MNKKLFPIGTVLSVEGVPTRVMVIGHLQQQKNSEKIWDYAAVPFPIGLLSPDEFVLFNHDKINLLYFIGLQDKEGLEYMKALYDQINDSSMTNNDD